MAESLFKIKKANDVVKLQALVDRKKVVVTEDVIRQDLRLDDADGVEYLSNEEIFAELARMGYEKPPPKLTCLMASAIIYLATCRKFTFSKYIFDNMVRNVDSPNKLLIVGKGFLEVETPLFASTLVQPQPQVAEEEDDVEEQPTDTFKSFMTLLNTLMETCATLSKKVAQLKQDKIAQSLEILKLNKRIKKLEKKRRLKSSGLKRLRKRKDDDNVATKDISDAEPTVFDDEEVTMTMAQTVIKMKAKKARLLDEQMAKRLHDEDVEQAAAIEKQEKDDLEKAKGLQLQYDDKQENIDWNVVAEQIQEKHLDNIRKYRSLKRKPVFIAQARKNMIIYLKNIVVYKMEHFREEPQKKIVAEETLLQESFKKLKAVEVSGSEVGGITEAYHSFEDMLKRFDREDLDALWRLVKEKFSSAMPTVDKEKALWVELTKLFEPNADDVFWKLQRYMHDPLTWKLYTNCGVHHVSSTRRHDIFMLTEKYYPLSNDVMIMMLSAKLQVEEDSDMARDLVMKIFMEANK
nr:hypothetical protein [Tanacetum cinerariifolium]